VKDNHSFVIFVREYVRFRFEVKESNGINRTIMDELDHEKIFNKIIFKELEPTVLNEEIIK
jgi:hypothetical protein